MSVIIEQDLKEILTKIDQRLERIENEVTDLKIGQTRIEGEIKRVEEKIDAQGTQIKTEIKRVEEKIDGLDKRLGFQEFINRGVLIGFIMAILGGLAKVFGFIPNP